MPNTIKARAKINDAGMTEVRLVITHPMTAETRNAQTGAVVEAHFIEEVTVSHGGAAVLAADWGQAVSANPYLEFSFSGAKVGDTVTCAWRDNKGQSDTAEFKIA